MPGPAYYIHFTCILIHGSSQQPFKVSIENPIFRQRSRLRVVKSLPQSYSSAMVELWFNTAWTNFQCLLSFLHAAAYWKEAPWCFWFSNLVPELSPWLEMKEWPQWVRLKPPKLVICGWTCYCVWMDRMEPDQTLNCGILMKIVSLWPWQK